MLADRNQTAHVYDEDIAGGICQRVPNTYAVEIQELLGRLNRRIEGLDLA